jgi:hypothetical protein
VVRIHGAVQGRELSVLFGVHQFLINLGAGFSRERLAIRGHPLALALLRLLRGRAASLVLGLDWAKAALLTRIPASAASVMRFINSSPCVCGLRQPVRGLGLSAEMQNKTRGLSQRVHENEEIFRPGAMPTQANSTCRCAGFGTSWIRS